MSDELIALIILITVGLIMEREKVLKFIKEARKKEEEKKK